MPERIAGSVFSLDDQTDACDKVLSYMEWDRMYDVTFQ